MKIFPVTLPWIMALLLGLSYGQDPLVAKTLDVEISSTRLWISFRPLQLTTRVYLDYFVECGTVVDSVSFLSDIVGISEIKVYVSILAREIEQVDDCLEGDGEMQTFQLNLNGWWILRRSINLINLGTIDPVEFPLPETAVEVIKQDIVELVATYPFCDDSADVSCLAEGTILELEAPLLCVNTFGPILYEGQLTEFGVFEVTMVVYEVVDASADLVDCIAVLTPFNISFPGQIFEVRNVDLRLL